MTYNNLNQVPIAQSVRLSASFSTNKLKTIFDPDILTLYFGGFRGKMRGVASYIFRKIRANGYRPTKISNYEIAHSAFTDCDIRTVRDWTSLMQREGLLSKRQVLSKRDYNTYTLNIPQYIVQYLLSNILVVPRIVTARKRKHLLAKKKFLGETTPLYRNRYIYIKNKKNIEQENARTRLRNSSFVPVGFDFLKNITQQQGTTSPLTQKAGPMVSKSVSLNRNYELEEIDSLRSYINQRREMINGYLIQCDGTGTDLPSKMIFNLQLAIASRIDKLKALERKYPKY